MAKDYHERIQKVVPKYLEQQEYLLKLIDRDKNEALRVLDLGCGPATLSKVILDAFPNATAVGVDFTEEMGKFAAEMMKPFGERFSFDQQTIEGYSYPKDSFDIVVAGLSIHHLTSEEKQEVFPKIHATLKEGGMFLMREIVKAATDEIHSNLCRLWAEHISNSGLDPEEVFASHKKNDLIETIEDQLNWMRAAGFSSADAPWRYINQAIFLALK